MIFPGTEVRLIGRQFPRSSFPPFLKIGALFLFFQPPGTSPDCHVFSNIMESGLATTSANSLQTPGCTLESRVPTSLGKENSHPPIVCTSGEWEAYYYCFQFSKQKMWWVGRYESAFGSSVLSSNPAIKTLEVICFTCFAPDFYFQTPPTKRNTVTNTYFLNVYVHPVPCTILRIQICIRQDKTYISLIISWGLFYAVISFSFFPSSKVEYLTYDNLAKDTLKKNQLHRSDMELFGVLLQYVSSCFSVRESRS